MRPFCPSCSAYLPAGARCPRCRQARPAIHIPIAPDRPCWQARVSGSPAGRLSLVQVEGRPVLIVPWGYQPRWGEPGQPDGGVTLLAWEDGQELRTIRLGCPVEGVAPTVAFPGVAGEGMVCATALASVGAGQGELIALDLRTGEERWRTSLGGAARSAPTIDILRVYIAACDGQLYCLDLRDGRHVWPRPTPVFERPTQIHASPLIVREKGILQAIVVATYGNMNRRLSGRVVAVDEGGRILWEQDAGGHARGTPVAARGRVYVTAYRDLPSAGVLMAFDLRRGQPVWDSPFVVQAQPGERRLYNLSAAPLYQQGVLYVGSLNHHLYALDAETGRVRWEMELSGGVAVTPAWVEGLLIVGCNDGKVYAIDPERQAAVWTFDLGAPVLTDPLAADGLVAVGAQDGTVAVLPWHLGQYAWAVERLKAAGRRSEAGDCQALAAHFSAPDQAQEDGYARAACLWEETGQPERAGEMWLALGRRRAAAQAFQRAGEVWRSRDPQRAGRYFQRAATLYFRLRQEAALNTCTRAVADCANLPVVWLEAINVPGFVQWEAGEFVLRLTNEGPAAVPGGVRLLLGGSLKSLVQAEIREPLDPGAIWNIPLSLVATQPEGMLYVELEYDPGAPGWGPLRQILSIPIHAAEPQRPPPSIHVGDVGLLRLEMRAETAEGVRIIARDVGVARTRGGGDRVFATGEDDTMIGRNSVGSAEVRDGERAIEPAKDRLAEGGAGRCPVCGAPLPARADQRFCEDCGARLIA